MSVFEFCCRLCTKVKCEEAQNLFEQQCNLLRHIEQLTGLILKDLEYLPQHICQQCLQDLKNARNFQKRCIKAQIYFISPEYERTAAIPSESSYQTCILQVIKSNAIAEHEEQQEFTELKQQSDNISATVKPTPLKHETNTTNESDNFCFVNKSEQEAREMIATPAAVCDYETLEVQLMNTRSQAVVKEASQNLSDDSQSTTNSYADTELSNASNSSRRNAEQTKVKHNNFICELCGTYYENINHFRTHMNRHSGEKPYNCDQCNAKYFTKAELKHHLFGHTGERHIVCRHCDCSFTSYGSRLRHERSHTNERPYVCSYCNKAFKMGCSLKDHLLTHTGERHFHCTLCKKSFQLRKHLRAHNYSQFHKQNEKKKQNNRKII